MQPVTPAQARVAEQRAIYGAAPRPLLGPPAGYYDGAVGKQGQALLDALRGIVTNTHVPLGYNQARDGLFALVEDTDGDDRVADLYTGTLKTGVIDRNTAFAHGLNTEHTWPQSLGAAGSAKSDLHQLMSSDINTNVRRSSFRYGVVSRETWKTSTGPGPGDFSRLGFDAQGQQIFEPRASERGNISRALLYFFTRYDSERPPRYDPTFLKAQLPTLLRWNQDDPVDAVEKLRNDAANALQGNRNPYVDHPEFVGQVGSAFEVVRLDDRGKQPPTAGH